MKQQVTTPVKTKCRFSEAQLRRMFEEGDVNHDQKIFNDELCNLLKKYDVTINDNTVQYYIDTYNVDKIDRYLDFNEFKNLCAGLFPQLVHLTQN